MLLAAGIFSNPQCTTQAPSIDVPDGWNAFWCARGAEHSIHGHVNWMPATWQGMVSWDGHSTPGTDDDYNINIVPPGGEGLTVSNNGHIHTEFDSDETIDHFRTPWWNSFHDAVDRDDASARAMIDGKFAIVVGLAGRTWLRNRAAPGVRARDSYQRQPTGRYLGNFCEELGK